MTRFAVLQAMTDAEKYAEMVWFMMRGCQSKEEFERLVKSELPEAGRQCMLNAAQNGYPLSLERLQYSLEVTEYISEIIKWKERFMGDKVFREYVGSLVKSMD